MVSVLQDGVRNPVNRWLTDDLQREEGTVGDPDWSYTIHSPPPPPHVISYIIYISCERQPSQGKRLHCACSDAINRNLREFEEIFDGFSDNGRESSS